MRVWSLRAATLCGGPAEGKAAFVPPVSADGWAAGGLGLGLFRSMASGILKGMGTGRHPVRGLCVAVDVHYLSSGAARAAAVVAADAAFAQVLAERTATVPEVGPYRPGEFYRRELPPLRAVLHGIGGLGLLVVDGYADLDPAGRPGLGAHVHTEFAVPVIGVAKSAFRTAAHAIPVLRGASARPVFVTAAGMPRADAAGVVRLMAGRFRVPDALRRADQLARAGPPAAAYRSPHSG